MNLEVVVSSKTYNFLKENNMPVRDFRVMILLNRAQHQASSQNYQYSSQHRLTKFFFLDQLWRLVNSRKLENKHEKWKFANNSWIIPEEGNLGYIEDSDTNHVLTVTDYNSGSNIFLAVKMQNYKIKFQSVTAQKYLQPHYVNGVFGNVYLSAGQH